jgi:MinD superfamily P-loop ATPase
MNLPFAVVINRCNIGNEELEKYCEAESINVLAKLPEDRRIAEVYSSGKMIVDELPEYRNCFLNLAEALKARV